MTNERDIDKKFMKLAYRQALKSFGEGGVPVGAVLVERGSGEVLARGHNERVQEGNPIAHGEMVCLREAGRRRDYRGTTLYTTLAPCMMCSGAIVQFGIGRVVVGEDVNFEGNLSFLEECGVEVVLMDDEDCRELMERFIGERPELWFEDIAETGD